MAEIVCGYLHNTLRDFAETGRMLPLSAPVRHHRYQTWMPEPAGVDGHQVYFRGQLIELSSFSPGQALPHGIVVLTLRERHILRRALGISGIRIVALEKQLPFLSHIKYLDNAVQNFRQLDRLTRRALQRYALPMGTFKAQCYARIARRVKCVSTLDSEFAFVREGGIQEAFTFCDLRDGRRVLAYDFNSMFPGLIIREKFPDPAALRYRSVNACYRPGMDIGYGIYQVELSRPLDDFIKNFHAMKYSFLSRRFNFRLRSSDRIRTVLYTGEIRFYARHFGEVRIIDGISSEKGISHPLAGFLRRLYSSRLNARRQHNEKAAEYEKFVKRLLTVACSAARTRAFERAGFKSSERNKCCNFLRSRFGIVRPDEMPMGIFTDWLSRSRKFCFTFRDGGFTLRCPSLRSADAQIFSLSAALFASARVRMLEVMELADAFTDAQICYVNVDSMHVSVPKLKAQAFRDYMVAQGVADQPGTPPQLGKMKLECEADCGCWFQPGRYWLFSHETEQPGQSGDLRVVKCANIFLNNRITGSVFDDFKHFDVVRRAGRFSILSLGTATLRGTMPATAHLQSRRLGDEHLCYRRFSCTELCSADAIEKTLQQEKQRSDNFPIFAIFSTQNYLGDLALFFDPLGRPRFLGAL